MDLILGSVDRPVKESISRLSFLHFCCMVGWTILFFFDGFCGLLAVHQGLFLCKPVCNCNRFCQVRPDIWYMIYVWYMFDIWLIYDIWYMIYVWYMFDICSGNDDCFARSMKLGVANKCVWISPTPQIYLSIYSSGFPLSTFIVDEVFSLPAGNYIYIYIYISWKIKEDASILCDSEFRA